MGHLGEFGIFLEQKMPVYLIIIIIKQGGNFCIWICLRICMMSQVHPYVTFFSSHISKARDLKIGMHISHINGSKVTNQIFDILLRSRDI